MTGLMVNNGTVIIAAGGTGGHLYPGIALAREIRKQGKEPVFVVRSNDACRDILEKEGLRYGEIPVAGMPRRLSLRFFSFFFLLMRSLVASAAFVKKEKPEAVVGMGGYISFPVILAGKMQGIPVVIHEQNCIPGLANKLLAVVADKVAVSFEGAVKYFPRGKTVVTGNPVREELFIGSPQEAYRQFNLSPERFTVLVFGGSQGASILNDTVMRMLPLLRNVHDRIQFLHITGKRDIAAAEQSYRDNGASGCVLPYLHRIGDAYAIADLIICRSGATTVAELKILGTPAILVPYLHATANHQEYNARVLVDTGQGIMVREKELSAEILAGIVSEHLKSFHGHTLETHIPPVLPQQTLRDLVLSRVSPANTKG